MESTSKTKRITIADIARESKVSSSAISSFLNNSDNGIRVSLDTQRRIIDACRELNYQPKSDFAQRLLYPQRGSVCFLMSSASPGGIQHQYFGQMLSGVVSALDDPTQPVAYSLFDPYIDYEAEPEKLPQPLRNGSSTRFIAASPPNTSLVKAATKLGVPFVYLGHHIDTPGLCCIMPDYLEATKSAVKYLAKLGHKRIAYLTGPFGSELGNMTAMERGFSEGIREAGLRLYPEYIYHCESELGEFPRENVVKAADHLVKLDTRPTAILCFHDPAAIIVSAHLQSLGIKIPHDISVMGCNDQPEASTHHPALTTVHFPLQEMGRRAVQEIDKQISLGSPEESELIKLPVRLVERMSCAAPVGAA